MLEDESADLSEPELGYRDRLVVWWHIHDGGRHAEGVWTVVFGGAMLVWPFIALAFGVNVFSSVWYWLTALI